MATITTRAGKGAPLTNAELDANFTNLNSAKLETTATTTNVAEGTRLYFTDARARAAISATGSLSYNSTTGVISFTQGNSDTVSEGTTNLYFTQARARTSVSAGTGVSYNSTTGVISSTITQYTDALARASISAGTGLSYNSTTGVMASTITQYTDALARASNSVTTGAAAYNSTTGVITIPGTSAHITESGNLFYTDARARAAVSAGTGISYNATTGVITSSITQYTDALARAALSFTAGSGAYNSTTGVFTIPTNTTHLTNGSGYITAAQTYFIGTTSNALNRASGAQTLTGVSIDGNAATATSATSATSATTAGTCTGNAATVTNGVYTTGDQSIAGLKNFTGAYLNVSGVSGSYNGTIYFGGTRQIRQVTSTNSWEMVNAANTAVIFTFDNSGNFTAAANVTAYSDERLKKDWTSFDGSFVDRLAEVKSGTYTRIDTEDRQAGVSAQSLQKLIPEAVHENEDGVLSVAYGNAAMVSAIELAKEIRALKAEIAELKGKYGN